MTLFSLLGVLSGLGAPLYCGVQDPMGDLDSAVTGDGLVGVPNETPGVVDGGGVVSRRAAFVAAMV